jgi:hypothetical protein
MRFTILLSLSVLLLTACQTDMQPEQATATVSVPATATHTPLPTVTAVPSPTDRPPTVAPTELPTNTPVPSPVILATPLFLPTDESVTAVFPADTQFSFASQVGAPLAAMAINEPYAYLLSAGTLLIVDVSNGENVQLVRQMVIQNEQQLTEIAPGGRRLQEITVVGERLLVRLGGSSAGPHCGLNQTIYLYSIADPVNPVLLGSEQNCFLGSMVVYQNSLYLFIDYHLSQPDLLVYDLTADKLEPVTTLPIEPFFHANEGFASGGELVLDEDQLLLRELPCCNLTSQLLTYDLADPLLPRQTAIYTPETLPDAWQQRLSEEEAPLFPELIAGGYVTTAVVGNTLYVLQADTLRLFALDEQSSPRLLHEWQWPLVNTRQLLLYQGYAYTVANAGLKVWQITGSTQPRYTGYTARSSRAVAIFTFADYMAFILQGGQAYQLWTRQDPAEPHSLVTLDLPAHGTWVDWERQEEWLWVTTTNGLLVINLSDLNNPVEEAFIPGLASNGRLALHQNTLYLLQENEVLVIEFHLPNTFNMRQTITDEEPILQENGLAVMLHDVAVLKNQLFVLTSGGTAVFDITEPQQPQPLRRQGHTLDSGRFYPIGEEILLTAGEQVGTGVNLLLVQAVDNALQGWIELSPDTSIHDVATSDSLLALAMGENGWLLLQSLP